MNRSNSVPVSDSSNDGSTNSRGYDMSKFLQPYKEGADMGLFLVNFERMCTQMGFAKETWSMRLMTVLPNSAAEVVARLSEIEARDYDCAKSGLLKKYKLTSEAFRSKFRKQRKSPEEGYAEYAYKMKANFNEWVNSEGVGNDYAKLVQLMCLEQFYSSLPEETRFWVEDRNSEKTVEKAAELSDEYVARRGINKPYKHSNGAPSYQNKTRSFEGKQQRWERGKEAQRDSSNSYSTSTQAKSANEGESKQTAKRFFEKKRPLRCYNCNGPHYAYQCDKPKVAFACVERNAEADRLLKPYLMDANINGKNGQVLRDSAATFDVVDKNWINSDDYTGKTIWLRAALTEESVCLPVAKITLKGEFGEIVTEAAVSKGLPAGCPYLLSNRTWEKVQSESANHELHIVQAITRSKANQIAERYYRQERVMRGTPPFKHPRQSNKRAENADNTHKSKERKKKAEKLVTPEPQKVREAEPDNFEGVNINFPLVT